MYGLDQGWENLFMLKSHVKFYHLLIKPHSQFSPKVPVSPSFIYFSYSGLRLLSYILISVLVFRLSPCSSSVIDRHCCYCCCRHLVSTLFSFVIVFVTVTPSISGGGSGIIRTWTPFLCAHFYSVT